MGTTFEIVVYARSESEARVGAAAAFDRVEELERILSDYDGHSELNQLCARAFTTPVRTSAELFRVLLRAQEISRLTDRAFDITVGPLVRLWRRARRQGVAPTEARLQEALRSVGNDHLVLDRDTRTVRLLRPDMHLDLGGIAKGYAVDEALRVLRERGLGRALVNGGGDVGVGDPPIGKEYWRLGLVTPDARPLGWIPLRNAALATSGPGAQAVEIGGVRHSHVIDPRTGRALSDHGVVSVVAPDAMTADALSSAIGVLGAESGVRLVESLPAIEVLIQPADAAPVRVSTAFPDLVLPGERQP